MTNIHATHSERFNHWQSVNSDKPTENPSPVDLVKKYEEMQSLLSMVMSINAKLNASPNSASAASKPELALPATEMKDCYAIYEKLFDKPLTLAKDYSAKDKYTMDRMAAMIATFLMASQILISNSILQGERITAQYKQAEIAAEALIRTGTDKAMTAFTSASASFLVACSGTVAAMKSTAKNIKIETTLSKKNTGLQSKNIANTDTVHENNLKLNKLKEAEPKTVQKDNFDRQKLNVEIEDLNNKNNQLNSRLDATENDLRAAQARGDRVNEDALTAKKREIKTEIDTNTDDISRKKASLNEIDVKQKQRYDRLEQLEEENRLLLKENNENNLQVENNNHELSIARNELNKNQALTSFVMQMQRPLSGVIESQGEVKTGQNNANVKMADTNNNTFAQNLKAVEEQIRIVKELMLMIKKIVEEFLRGNEEMQKTMIRG